MTSSLFIREPETLDGYVPTFSREEVKLGYVAEQVLPFRGLGYMDDEEVPTLQWRGSITILGHKISASRESSGTAMDDVVQIVNEFLASSGNKRYYPAQWEFLTKNAAALNNDKRYWAAVEHREEIEATHKKALELLERVRRAEWVASMYAAQVKAKRWFTEDEKALLLAEFSGGEYGELK